MLPRRVPDPASRGSGLSRRVGDERQGWSRAIGKGAPDMVLTDFMMPVADGLEMVRGVHALPDFQSLPVVVMSASPKRVALPTRMVGVTAFPQQTFWTGR